MQISGWQVSTIFLAGMVCAQFFGSQLTPPVDAAPADVLGSPLIPVTTYRNLQGNFIVWSDGHITKAGEPNTVLNQLADYVPVPGFPKPTQVAGKVQGSPNVPVGAYQDKNGSYVLFADGSTRKPNGASGSAEWPSPKVRSAQCDGNTFSSNNPEITVTGAGTTGQYWINFNPPFKTAPTVCVSASGFVGGIYGGLQYPDRCKVFTADFSGGAYRTNNMPFTVIAVGE